MEHAGVKQTSGAASLAAGARIGSGLIGQLAPASSHQPAPHILMLNNHFLHSTHREDYSSTSTRVWSNAADSEAIDGGHCDRKWKCIKNGNGV